MTLLLHAITRPSEASGDLVTVEAAGLTAWVSHLPSAREAFTREDMLAHHGVVSEIFAHVEAILPARFPTLFEDTSVLRARLELRRAELTDQLAIVSGCCELAVTALWTAPEEQHTPPEVEAASAGRRYMLQRQRAFAGSERRHARARTLADELERTAGVDVVAVERQLCPSPTVAFSMALLIKRSNALIVEERLPRTEQDVRILVNGPWPPYTFAAVRSD